MTKGRDSGMPAVEQWESYFDAAGILESLGCRRLRGDVVEFGCGYGTFTIPAAQRTSGTVYALDIDPLMVAATAARASQAGLKNVVVEQRDFVARRLRARIAVVELRHAVQYSAHRRSRRPAEGGSPGASSRRDGRSHSLEPRRAHAARAAAHIRPRPEQCRAWGEEAALRWVRDESLLPGSPWHWGMVLERP